jgi:predicted dehydrogenase
MSKKETRRSFSKKAGVAALSTGSFLNLNPLVKGANEKIVLALIGGRNQGRGVARRAIRQGAEIKTFCDLDDTILSKVGQDLEKEQNRGVTSVKDYRRVLDDKDIDGVIIATPDHWHTHIVLPACQAGKDVYVEKPLSQTIREGQLIRDAARKYNRVVQLGTQSRSQEFIQEAMEYIGSGKLGKICLIKAWMRQVRKTIGNPPDGLVPAGVDYDVWLGPARKRPFNPNRFHYTWRFFWDYGNSELGNQGVHKLDVAAWAIAKLQGLENCLPRRISASGGIYWLDDAKEVPDTEIVNYDYGDFMLTWELHSFQNFHLPEGSASGIVFYGPDSVLAIDNKGWRVTYNNKEPGPSGKRAGGSHEGNFLACIKSRKRPNGDVEIGRISTTLCHLGNISYHLRREVRFDPKTETFGNDKEANAYLTKEYRKSYELPMV